MQSKFFCHFMVFIGLSLIGLAVLIWSFMSDQNLANFFDKQKEYITELHDEIIGLPDCSEKHLLHLTYDSYIKDPLNSEFVKFIGDVKLPLQQLSEDEIAERLKLLVQSLQQEELLSSKVKASLDQIKTKIASKDWKEAHRELQSLLRDLRSLDIPDLFRLIRKDEKSANLIKDKDIVLLLGPTGAGKTATIHFLAGSKMTETKEDGMYHVAPTYIKHPDLLSAVTSPTSASLTRYITSINVTLSDVDSSYSGHIILCDSPGMGDLAGPEVDIANGLGVINAIKGARSVKLVILISSKGIGNRHEGLRSLLNTLSGIMKDLRSQLSSFSYYFTRYTEKDRNYIPATLANIRSNLNAEEESNENLVGLLEDMIRKTAKGPAVIDLLKGKPGPLLKELRDSPSILYPNEVFTFAITQDSRFAVDSQVNKHRKSIFNSIRRSDYQLAKYKLNELQQLSEMLGYEHIKEIYNECEAHYNKNSKEDDHEKR